MSRAAAQSFAGPVRSATVPWLSSKVTFTLFARCLHRGTALRHDAAEKAANQGLAVFAHDVAGLWPQRRQRLPDFGPAI